MSQESQAAIKKLLVAVRQLRVTVLQEKALVHADLKESHFRFRHTPRSKRNVERFHQKRRLCHGYHRASMLLAYVERALRGLMQNPAKADRSWHLQTAFSLEGLFFAVECSLSGDPQKYLPPMVADGISRLPFTEEVRQYLVGNARLLKVPVWFGTSLPTSVADKKRLAAEVREDLFRRIAEAQPNLTETERAVLSEALLGVAA